MHEASFRAPIDESSPDAFLVHGKLKLRYPYPHYLLIILQNMPQVSSRESSKGWNFVV